MKKLISLLVLSITLISFEAWGIRVIGGGGGLGEMQILSIFSRLQTLSRLCLQPAANCGLTRDERKALKLLLDSSLLDTAGAKIEFFYEATPQSLFRYKAGDNDYVSISGNALYARDGQPKSAAELASLAFEAWTTRDLVQITLKQANLEQASMADMAKKIFQNSEISSQTVEMNHGIFIHQFNLKKNGLVAGSVLYMEQPNATTDITPQIIKKACRNGAGRLVRIVRMSRQGSALDARIEWECEGRGYMSGNAVIIPIQNSATVGLTMNSLHHIPERDCGIYLK